MTATDLGVAAFAWALFLLCVWAGGRFWPTDKPASLFLLLFGCAALGTAVFWSALAAGVAAGVAQ